MQSKVVILDFGSQYTQLIARRVRECNVFCEIRPFHYADKLDEHTAAVILSGSPASVLDEGHPEVDLNRVIGHYPVLSICYGAQLVAVKRGGRVEKSTHREYGKAQLHISKGNPLLEGIENQSQIWMSHGDSILEIPNGFEVLATTENIPVAVFGNTDLEKPVYCLQFHPEVAHTSQGKTIMSNFLYNIAGLKADWTPASFIDDQIAQIKDMIGDDRVVMGLSGGVDSTVAATLISRAIGDQLICIFVDNGLLRKDEFQQVLKGYEQLGLQVDGVDAKERFYEALAGESDPERKRKIIGGLFIDVFQEEANKFEGVKWLGQGTIYPDVIESVSVQGPSVTIKSHHNVGGLPERLHLSIIEPLRMLFKDEVRAVGDALELPDIFIHRHPFPGPGLGIRILGDITPQKVALLQEADAIYINELRNSGWYDKVWQAGAILLPIQTVGVMGDERTYEQAVALRAVNSTDGMTAEWSKLPYELLADISSKIINRVKGINRVVYDISTKPPATIEWE